MKVAISIMVTPGKNIDRKELIRKLQKKGHEVVYIGKELNEELNSDFEQLNVKFHSISMERETVNPLRELISLFKTQKKLKEESIEAMVIYGIRLFPLMVIAAKIARVKKIFCVVNGSGRLFKMKGKKSMLVKLISYPMLFLSFNLANLTFFQNKDDLELMKKKKLIFNERKYELVNGSGVNLEKFAFQELEEKPIFSMISRLTGSKGVNEYIQAAVKVKKKYPEAIFNLIGPMDDSDKSIDKKQMQDAINQGIISFTSKVKDVRPYIKKTRFFVLPSYYPEGVPRSILEAMAMGRPILTTTSPGCKETVVNGANGFLVPPRDAEALAERMIWFVDNEAAVEKMSKESRIICEDKFDVNKINEQMIKVMDL